MLLGAIGFNLWIYRLEPAAHVDPNDNTFQFALVDRTNQIWSFAQQKCSTITRPFCMLSYLADHWVPNWAQGYNLPYYYSHLPQIVIVATYRLSSWFFSLFTIHYSLFTYYHWVIYLLLSLFPLTLFMALRVVGLSWVTAGFGALISTHLSTDGLYGLDPTSFLWRGYGLSSQLFAAFWLPLALAYAWRFFTTQSSRRSLVLAIFSLAATTAGHLGIGMIAFMSVGVIAVAPYVHAFLAFDWNGKTFKEMLITGKKLLVLFGAVGLLLGYWIIPILLDDNYHNISVWDGVWKFDSFGYREVLKNLFNGDLFDFGRLPILTLLVGIGFFIALLNNQATGLASFAFLFAFWLLLYFGRTTWGGLVDLIPGMSEFHLSRFIVGVQAAGLFLIPIGIQWISSSVWQFVNVSTKKMSHGYMVTLIVIIGLIWSVYPQTIRYAAHNDFLIKRANESFARDEADIRALFSTLETRLSSAPGRVFAGRGGSWGRDFRIAETPIYMHLSTYGIPVILWLPQTWSPNSDTEQYFSESNAAHYTLYNVRYVVTPTNLAKEHMQPFWKPLTSGKTWRLYEVAADGYITSGVKPAIVSTAKTDYRSLVRLWMHADYSTAGLYPELTFDPSYPKDTGLPNFRMLDEVTYKIPDGSLHNLFAEIPRYVNPSTMQQFNNVTILSQETDEDMVFRAKLEVKDPCVECLVVLRQSFHPSWRAMVDGKPASTFSVFPFYTAIQLDTPGAHEIVFSYEPSPLKQFLLFVSIMGLLTMIWLTRQDNLQNFKA